jgi:hypothetical protein
MQNSREKIKFCYERNLFVELSVIFALLKMFYMILVCNAISLFILYFFELRRYKIILCPFLEE